MNSANKLLDECDLNSEELDDSAFDEFEKTLEDQLLVKEAELKSLKKDFEQIASTTALGENIKAVVWEQFCNQVATVAGEDFIRENRGMTLDLRDSAHIQTTENFAKGKIATHNTEIDYQGRHDAWQANFMKDENGNNIMHDTRTGKKEATLVKEARKPFDKDRPKGSAERKTDMDHTVSAGEIIRDAEANAHLAKSEQIDFANSDSNLNEMPSEWNRSKQDKSMSDWLDNPNQKGQKPEEIFDNLTPEEQKRLREKDAEARKEYEKRKKEGEKRSIETGKKSQREEALRIGKAELKSILMRMLVDLLKRIMNKVVAWLMSAKKGIESLIDEIKKAFLSFATDFKSHVVNAADSFSTTLATALFGPVIRIVKKFWTMLKQAFGFVKKAWIFLRDPQNASMPFSVKIMHVGEIVTAGLVGMGAVAMGQAIEAGLMTIPILAIEIPLIGSIASLLGIFLGAVISGILGAIVINWIQKMIEKALKGQNIESQVSSGNEVVAVKNAQETFLQGKNQILKAAQENARTERRERIDAKITELERLRMIDESIDTDTVAGESVVDDNATRLDDTNKGLSDLIEG